MTTITELQARARALSSRTETDSITPEEVGGLQRDSIDYMAELERSGKSLGIRKVYASVDEMEAAGTSPVGEDGKALKYGQLASIYHAGNAGTENGNIYAFQNPGWLLVGSIGNYDPKDKIANETTARIAADKSLQDAITREASDRKTADDTLQAHIDNISGHAYNGAFLKVEDFSDGVNPAISESDRRAVIASNCKEWLDGVKFNGDDWRRTGGRCKLAFDGANFECYNFELFVSGNIGLQVVVGAVNYDPAYDTIVTNNGTFNVLYRRHTADGWGEWTDIRTSGILQETGDATDKTMSQKAVTEALRTITDRLDKAGDAVGGNTVNVTEEYPPRQRLPHPFLRHQGRGGQAARQGPLHHL